MSSRHPSRSAQPGRQSTANMQYSRPHPQSVGSSGSVSFQPTERGDRAAPIQSRYSHPQTTHKEQALPPTPLELMQDADEDSSSGSFGARVGRKKSLVRPDREKIDPGHRQFHYRNHVAHMTGDGRIMPSTTGNYPQSSGLRRGKSLLAREEDMPESGLSIFKRSTTLRRPRSQSGAATSEPKQKRGCFDNIAPGPKDWFMIYSWLITCWVPSFLLKACGIRTPEQQRAWREKMGLLSYVLVLMAAVGFLTFGFTQTVCGKPPLRYHAGSVDKGFLLIHGEAYDLSKFNHPAVSGFFNGQQNPLFIDPYNAGGMDASFLFQNVNLNCRNLITVAPNSAITHQNGDLAWYFPCHLFNQFGTTRPNISDYDQATFCHTDSKSRQQLRALTPSGQVFYTWDDVKNPQRNLVTFESSVLDLDLLQWLDQSQVTYPALFDRLKTDNSMSGHDITMSVYRAQQKSDFRCLQDIITVGFIDTNTIGCVASEVVLVISLVFIIGVVAIRFAMAVIFGWFVSWRLGSFKRETYAQRMQRAAEIENWTEDIYRPAPGRYRPTVHKDVPSEKLHKQNVRKSNAFLPVTSRFTKDSGLKGGRPATTYSVSDVSFRRNTLQPGFGGKTPLHLSPPELSAYGGRGSRSSTSLADKSEAGRHSTSDPSLSSCPFPLHNVVPQPPADYEPFNFPLAHTICLVTAYSESVEGLRTTLDSLATTDYPNSHKLILVIADGMVKGSGNTRTTPDILLSMMKEFIVHPADVEPHSYVAIADGHKRHNMAKVYAGFYDYNDNSVEMSKQQRVPMVLVAKCGNPLEINEPKPGNRGKRDSQIVLMAFLQKVMFDERMTTMEYEFFNAIWRVTGISPDRYEYVLCVDADTKVFPDSLTRMAACMAHDEEIMGLCGETKIANKAETWVTMIQVFEYYISHHLTKAFESMFGGVTCLPGCFSMYRVKAPKGTQGYWVPVLANPDIIEHYSENIVDTLHKKNLLLLGEDRYLTTLMLKTFPKRKMMFCPQAVCKTIVPDTFGVLLSQRRRWINSTVHNLAELLFVRDLCGTFCFSMQFVVFMELMGTLVLPAAISFTIYLVVISIIPGHQNTTIPLVLLGIILGLPGLLIVLTSRKIAYVGWMFIYLLSLPIWNFVLPAYAFWHFDDFSWGQTRKISGGEGKNHGDKEGEFDSSHIVMKRWAEFERDRRWKSGSNSRDSVYYDRSNSPKRAEENNNRFSMVSTVETFTPPLAGYGAGGFEADSSNGYGRAPLLHLPAPLGRGSGPNSSSPVPNMSPSRSSEDTFVQGGPDSSHQRLIPHADYQLDDNSYEQAYSQPVPNQSSIESHMTRMGGVLRQGTLSSQYPGETQNPYRYSEPLAAQAATSYEEPYAFNSEYDEPNSATAFVPSRGDRGGRGVSLADNGPVPGPEGVRRIARPQARRASQQNPPPSGANRYSRSSPASSLPPGAAAPNIYQYRDGGR
ncbi:glycosyltransferase family 2 protein [Hysterangium stoloniferum]|nr:glycosyltransferase family 2 protein [Hysterangium stoloniferum]